MAGYARESAAQLIRGLLNSMVRGIRPSRAMWATIAPWSRRAHASDCQARGCFRY